MKLPFFLITIPLFWTIITEPKNIDGQTLKFHIAGDSVLIYANELQILDERSFTISNKLKLEKIKNKQILDVYLLCQDFAVKKVGLKNILSSSGYDCNFYIHITGENKIHLASDSITICNEKLTQRLKECSQ